MATKQPLMGGRFIPHPSEPTFVTIQGAPYARALLTGVDIPLPNNGVLLNLRVRTSEPPIGGYTFTIVVNGVPTLLTCTVSGLETRASCIGEVSVAAGDKVHLRVDPFGDPTLGVAAWVSLAFRSSVACESMILSSYDTHLGGSSMFTGLFGKVEFQGSESEKVRAVCPISCSIRHLRIGFEAVNPLTFIFNVNGNDTPLQCTVSQEQPEAVNLVDSVSVNAGDTISFKVTSAGPTPPAFIGYSSLKVVADVDGWSIAGLGKPRWPLFATHDSFSEIANFRAVGWAAEDNQRNLAAEECRVQNLYVGLHRPLVFSSPAGLVTRVRVNSVDSDIVVTIPSTEDSGHNLLNFLLAKPFDSLSLRFTPISGTDFVGDVGWGLGAFGVVHGLGIPAGRAYALSREEL